MRRALVFLFLLSLMLALPLSVSAKEEALENTENSLREGLTSLLPDIALSRIPDPTDTDAVKNALGFGSLFSLLTDTLAEEGGALSGRLLSLFAVTLLFGILSVFAKGSSVTLFAEGAAALSFFSLLFESADGVFAFFTDLSHLTLGISSLYAGLFAAGGATVTAAAASGGFASFLSLLSLFSTTVFPPLLRILFALALLSSLGNHTLVRELSRRLTGIAILFFSLLSMLLLSSLAFQGALASGADSVALRTVKYTASSAIPVVGGTLSGALGALGASLKLLKSALGGTAVIALLALVLPPLVEVFLLRLALSFSESIAAFTEASALKEIIARFRGVLDLALAALVIVSLLFLLSLGVYTAISPFGT